MLIFLALIQLQKENRDIKTVREWNGIKPSFKEIGSESFTVKSLWNQLEILEIKDELLENGKILKLEKLDIQL